MIMVGASGIRRFGPLLGGLMVAMTAAGYAAAEHKNIVPLGTEVTNVFSADESSDEAVQLRADLLRQVREAGAIAQSFEQANDNGEASRVQPLLQSKRQELKALRQTLAQRKAAMRDGKSSRAAGKAASAQTDADPLDERLGRLEGRLAALQDAKTDGARRSALADVKSLLKSYELRQPQTVTPAIGSPGWSREPPVVPTEHPTEQQPAYMTRGFKSSYLIRPQEPAGAVSQDGTFTPAQGIRGA